MSSDQSPSYELYTYFRSSCSARLRIALNLKSIPYKPVFVHLLQNEQSSESHKALNPSGTVPVLVVHTSGRTVIPQSVAALEYLEEAIPPSSPYYRPLLPADPEQRAAVRTLVSIIVTDIQPLTNLRTQGWVRGLYGAEPLALCHEATVAGFSAYESIVSKTAGVFSVGDSITLADVCLVPAAWSAFRSNVNITDYPTVARIVARLEQEDAVKKAHWQNQPDTPKDLRP